jgi:hypothetical protein
MYLYMQISGRSSNIKPALKFHGGTSDLCSAQLNMYVPTCKQLQSKTPLRFISFTNFNVHLLYLLTICMLHYNPRHVSSINMPIFRRTNCIITAHGIVTLCNGCTDCKKQSALIRHTVQPFTESDDTRCCDNTICPLEDGHFDARNMSRIVM